MFVVDSQVHIWKEETRTRRCARTSLGSRAARDRQYALILALDPAAFGDPTEFTRHVAETLTAWHGLPHSDPATPIRYYPGENSAAVAESRTANGVPVAPKVRAELEVAASKLGVALPARSDEG